MVLNANATPFVPSSASAKTGVAPHVRAHKHHRNKAHKARPQPVYTYYPQADSSCYDYDMDFEGNVTAEELEELEACDEWVRTMAQLEELEREHLVSMALSMAPEELLEELERKQDFTGPRAGPKKRNSKGKSSQKQ